jgi:hypothetical protein
MQGSNSLSMISLPKSEGGGEGERREEEEEEEKEKRLYRMILKRSLSAPWLDFLFFFPFSVSISLGGWSEVMARWKLSSLNLPFSSTTKYSPSLAEGKMKCCRGTGLSRERG